MTCSGGVQNFRAVIGLRSPWLLRCAKSVDPDAYCEEKVGRSRSNFAGSFRILPEARRRAITAVYAFCREVDDIVDEVADPSVARMKLAWWRTEIAAAYRGSPQHPVAQALQKVDADLLQGESVTLSQRESAVTK